MDNASWQYDRDLFQQQGLTSGLLFEDDAQLAFDDQYMAEELDMDGGDYDYIDDLEDPSDYDVREVLQGRAVWQMQATEVVLSHAAACEYFQEERGGGVLVGGLGEGGEESQLEACSLRLTLRQV